ncbi:MAG TPA: hypothetical protein VFH72_14230 [Candidatus Baltobacteraceae bacterium]|nr:hypothetical protein [Candidatus Baltobacteraceae bacterium]
MRLHFMAGAAFAFGVLLAACSGNSGSGTLPIHTPSQLGVTVTIPANNSSAVAHRRMAVGDKAKSAFIYVYSPSGGEAPPASALAGVIDLSAASKDCATSSTGRVCHTVATPSSTGSMDVHVDFYDQPPSNGQPSGKKVASTHSRQTLSGNDAYSIVTDGTIAKLEMTVSREYFSGASDFYVSLQPLDSAGDIIAMPGEVAIYAPSGSVIAAAAPKTSPPPIIADGVVADTSDGTARFHYTGAPLVNPVTVVGIAGTFSQTAQIFPWNATSNLPATYPAGTPLTFDEKAVFGSASTDSYHVDFSIGSSSPVSAQVDTGSELFIIPPDAIAGAGTDELLGPGDQGFESLSSDGNFYAGHYYLARVKLYDPNTTRLVGRTVPMRVLVEDRTDCSKCGHAILMGVGFGRPATAPDKQYGETEKSPLTNTFLQQEAIVTGTTLAAGYRFTSSTLQVGLSSSNTADFASSNFQQLARFSGRPGDWNTPTGCVSFDKAACVPGALLVDVGIKYMILNSFGSAAKASGITVYFLGGDGTDPSLIAHSLSFTPRYGDPPNGPDTWDSAPSPAYVNLRDNATSPDVNTGIQPLSAMDYLYDNVYGRAGYKSDP